jgi:hypothetical protein
MNFFPLKFFLDKIYPAIELKSTLVNTTKKVTTRLLTINFRTGRPNPINTKRSLKLLMVGWMTKKRGGKAKSSSIGLKAVEKI